MRRYLTLVSVVALAAALAIPAGAGDRVPFKGADTGSFSVVDVVSLEPFVIRTAGTFSGHATHLGRYELVASESVNLESLAITDGEYALTAADGAVLVGTYRGAGGFPDEDLISWSVSGPITGGTGRLAGATGVLTFDGLGVLSTGAGDEQISGWISSPGAVERP